MGEESDHVHIVALTDALLVNTPQSMLAALASRTCTCTAVGIARVTLNGCPIQASRASTYAYST